MLWGGLAAIISMGLISGIPQSTKGGRGIPRNNQGLYETPETRLFFTSSLSMGSSVSMSYDCLSRRFTGLSSWRRRHAWCGGASAWTINTVHFPSHTGAHYAYSTCRRRPKQLYWRKSSVTSKTDCSLPYDSSVYMHVCGVWTVQMDGRIPVHRILPVQE